MKLMETGSEKVKKICEVLRRDTLEPARGEAEEMISAARNEAERILKAAHEKASGIVHDAEDKMRKQEEVFKASLNLSFKQSIAKLKNEVQKNLFLPALKQSLDHTMSKEAFLEKLFSALMEGIKQSGLSADISLILPRAISKEDLSKFIIQCGFEDHQNKVVAVGPFKGGFQVKFEKEHMTVDLTEETIMQMILDYTSESFRKLVFNI